jgi:D-glycero-alpha-D-manno-heptose-7-phosphate kinase
LGFAGGGTDLSPFCDLHGGAILNATITLFATTVLQPSGDGRVRFAAIDREQSAEFDAAVALPLDGPLPLHCAVYNHIVREFCDGEPIGIEMSTYSDVPAGSGLGASSTLVVTMVQAFAELLSLPLGDYDIAQRAWQIERVEFGSHGGRQDQYAATFGGFNFMEFYANDRVIVNPLRVKNHIVAELEASMILCYSGVSRDSAGIIDGQIENIEKKDAVSMEAMRHLRENAFIMKEKILKGDIYGFAEVLGDSWQNKKKTASKITNSNVECLFAAAMEAGAIAGKLSGAGGGGFMMFIADPMLRPSVAKALTANNGTIIPCQFTTPGAQSWRVSGRVANH